MKLLRLLVVILLLVSLIIAGVFVFFRISLAPALEGEIQLPGMEVQTEVLFDEWGIPHIYAESNRDAYYALGYFHAQDRLFQMDLLRRVGGGELAEFFGQDVVSVDRLFRTLGIPRYAHQSASAFDALPPDTRTAAMAYLEGVNQFVATGFTPLEYTLAGLPKEPFNVQDIYEIAGYMAFSFSPGLRTEPLVDFIASNLGEEYLNDLCLHHDSSFPVAPSGRDTSAAPVLSSAVLSALDDIALPLFMGSNNWVVSGSKTTSGKPILCNDTHIRYSQPATWYEAHLEYPGFSFYGNFLAGIPFALVGHNTQIAWGLTMFENDDTDFYFEEFHPEDSTLVRFMDSLWVPVQYRTELINVKDAAQDTLLVTETPHGPLVNAFFDPAGDRPVSMFWTYTKKDNELPQAFHMLNKASDINQAREAVKMIHAPGLNVAYADVDNQIALWSAAHLLHRPAHVDAKRILNGASGADEPLGYFPFSANPQQENPLSGVVFSANSQHDTTAAGVMHPGYYLPPARMDAISSWLKEDKMWDMEQMKSIISDHHSRYDAQLAQRFFDLISLSGNDELTRFFGSLNSWNGSHLPNDVAPVVYYPLLYEVLFQAFADDLGEDAFDVFLSTHLMKRSIFTTFYLDSSPWFATKGDGDNTLAPLVQRAAEKARARTQLNGKDITWGDVHTVEFAHPMAAQPPLDKIFNVGPFAISGTNESIDQEAFTHNPDGNYPVIHGPQMRIIIDMANPDSSISVNPTGQSGNRFSPHYSDQAALFVNHRFRPQLMNRSAIERSSSNRLMILPE